MSCFNESSGFTGGGGGSHGGGGSGGGGGGSRSGGSSGNVGSNVRVKGDSVFTDNGVVNGKDRSIAYVNGQFFIMDVASDGSRDVYTSNRIGMMGDKKVGGRKEHGHDHYDPFGNSDFRSYPGGRPKKGDD